MSTHYHVKCRCSKLSHNAIIISIRLLTFASSIRQSVPHDLIILWFKYFMLKYSTLKANNSGWQQHRVSDIHRQTATHMADMRRDWLTNQNTDWCFGCDWFSRKTIPQSFATAKNSSSLPTKVRHIGWHLTDAREYLLTSVASMISRRIFIYIRGWHQWTQNMSDQWMQGAVWPVDHWCHCQPVASSSKRLCLCTQAHFEHKISVWQLWNKLLYKLIILLNKPYFSSLCAN